MEVDWEGLERVYAGAGLPPQIPATAVRASLPVTQGGNQVGYASTSTWSPVLKKYIALTHLQRPYYEPGTRLSLEITVASSPPCAGHGGGAAVLRARVEEEVTA